MEIKKGLSLLFYMIFFIFLFIYSEYLEYIQLNEMYRLLLILTLFFINTLFTIIMNHIEDKVYKKLRIPYVISWSYTIISFSTIVILPTEIILFTCILLFILYSFLKLLIYKKTYNESILMLLSKCNKFKFLCIIIVFTRYNELSNL